LNRPGVAPVIRFDFEIPDTSAVDTTALCANRASHLPTFFIIGAGKSGTTSLYHYLKQHPDVYMSPVKEPLFFAFAGQRPNYAGPEGAKINARAITSFDAYQALFREGAGRTALGEASSAYLYYPCAAERIRQLLPQAKLIVILRCPADRAYSNYLHALRIRSEPIKNFVGALEAEPHRIAANWSHFYHYRAKGWYFRQLKPWVDLFPRDQFLFNLYEDLQQNPGELMRRVFQFIGVDPNVPIHTQQRFNVSGRPLGIQLHHFLQSGSPLAQLLLPKRMRADLKKAVLKINLRKDYMPPDVRRELLNDYAPDIAQLSSLIGRDLSAWLSSVETKC
jgi:sulfotransferase family protein